MADRWLKSSSDSLAEFYSLVLDYQRDYEVFAPDPVTEADLLHTRAELERRHYLDAEVKRADEIILRQGVSYDYSAQGPEWPFHLPDIQAGRYPLERLPKHLRGLAEELYYHKMSV